MGRCQGGANDQEMCDVSAIESGGTPSLDCMPGLPGEPITVLGALNIPISPLTTNGVEWTETFGDCGDGKPCWCGVCADNSSRACRRDRDCGDSVECVFPAAADACDGRQCRSESSSCQLTETACFPDRRLAVEGSVTRLGDSFQTILGGLTCFPESGEVSNRFGGRFPRSGTVLGRARDESVAELRGVNRAVSTTTLPVVLAGVAVFATACGSDSVTEIVLGISSSRPHPCAVDAFTLEVVEPAGARRLIEREAFPADGTVRVTLVPRSGMTTTVRLIVFQNQQEVGRAEATLDFESGRSLYFPLRASDADGCFPGPCEVSATRGDVFTGDLPEDARTPSCLNFDGGVPGDGCTSVAEICNGVSDDCDDEVDEGAVCAGSQVCAGGSCVPAVSGYAVAPVDPDIELFSDGCNNPSRLANVLADSDANAELLYDLPEGFQFEFLGQPVESIWIGENGYVAFSEAPPSTGFSTTPQDPQGCNAIRPGVFPFWDDLATRSQGVCTTLTGDDSHQRLTITWSAVCFSDCLPGTEMSFSIVLEEVTHHILFLYGDMEAASGEESRVRGLNAAIGLSAYGGDSCKSDAPRCQEQCAVSNSIRYRDGSTLPVGHVFRPIAAE